MYKVIHFFTDLQDNSHPYNVGDVFPHADAPAVSAERIKELSGSDNKQHVPLIEAVTAPVIYQPDKAEKEQTGGDASTEAQEAHRAAVKAEGDNSPAKTIKAAPARNKAKRRR